jgi:hypothetical protein
VNFFQPSFKLASKTRVGAKVTKRYDVPATPCARLLAADSVTKETKDKLPAVAASLDPLRLLDQIRSMQRHLVDLAASEVPSMVAKGDPELEDALKSLRTAWQNGEVRPTHIARDVPLRDWRTRLDPFEMSWPLVRRWLEAEPNRTAKELFIRLQGEMPDAFPHSQLRTLQRRVQAWRSAEARRLILSQRTPKLLTMISHVRPGNIPW